MTRVTIGLFVCALAVSLVESTVAQPTGAAAVRPDPQQRRDKIKQRIRAIRAYTLTEELALDEATAAKLFPALAKYDEEFDRLFAARDALQKRLVAAATLTNAKATDQVIDDVVANQQAIRDTEARRLEQLRRILTPAQAARTLIVLPAIERRIQRGLRAATVAKPGGGKASVPRTGAPDMGGELTNPFDKPAPARKP